MDLLRKQARVGNHNGRCIYFEDVDKPYDERGGGASSLVAVTVGDAPEAEEIALWMVAVMNRELDEARRNTDGSRLSQPREGDGGGGGQDDL